MAAKGRRVRRAAKAAMLACALSLPAAGHATGTLGAHISTKSAAPAPKGFAGICIRHEWACARGQGTTPITDRHLRLADQVNRSVNARVRLIEDADQYRREDCWTLPSARGGDCEDIALLKKAELIRLGISPDRLLLATVLDHDRNNHAVPVLRSETGDYVLDNLTSRILHWSQTRHSFLRMQNPRTPDRWQAIMAGGIFGG